MGRSLFAKTASDKRDKEVDKRPLSRGTKGIKRRGVNEHGKMEMDFYFISRNWDDCLCNLHLLHI